MCFIKNNMNDLPLIAEEDIICYKLGKIENDVFISSDRGFQYELNKIYTEENHDLNIKDTLLINKGFHSYCPEAYKLMCTPGFFIKDKMIKLLVECIIPKGSLYLISPAFNISNQIIIKSILRRLDIPF